MSSDGERAVCLFEGSALRTGACSGGRLFVVCSLPPAVMPGALLSVSVVEVAKLSYQAVHSALCLVASVLRWRVQLIKTVDQSVCLLLLSALHLFSMRLQYSSCVMYAN